MKKILITGALGQIGSELTEKLRDVYGAENVIGTDIRESEHKTGPFEIVDVTDEESLLAVCQKHEVDTIMHLAALLSAKAKSIPRIAWDINKRGLMNALEVAHKLNLLFITPSSIASFEPWTPKKDKPKHTI